MNVKIQTVHFSADDKLVDHIKRKVEKISTFHDNVTTVDVFLKLDNIVHTIKDKVVELRVHVPKRDFFVKCSSKSFEESFENALLSMINQIKRQKERQAA
jgi:putative sigma-54 modulation protein